MPGPFFVGICLEIKGKLHEINSYVECWEKKFQRRGHRAIKAKKRGADKQSEADIQQHPQTLTANRRDSNVEPMATKQEIEAIF